MRRLLVALLSMFALSVAVSLAVCIMAVTPSSPRR